MAAVTPEQKTAEKNLQRENKTLRNEIKQVQNRVRTMQADLTKSNSMKDRLEALCRELQKQNKFIKAESSAKIQEANEKGKELAVEVQNNMGFMKNINENLASITAESQKVRKENEELAKKVCVLQDYYEQREKILQDALQEAKTGMVSAKTQLAEFNLKNAQEKEKLIKEMQQLADALEKSHEQIKHGKETEKGLRALIQNYDDKFNGLQKALMDTNSAYTDFKKEMEKVTLRTKELEKDTMKWQQRWEESNAALTLMNKSHEKIKTELGKSHESLATMTNLCRALQAERKDLLNKISPAGDSVGDEDPSELPSSAAVQPSEPAVIPSTPTTDPAAPVSVPAAQASGPAAQTSAPATPLTDTVPPPTSPAVQPTGPTTQPADLAAKTVEPAAKTVEPATKTVEPASKAVEPATKTVEPATKTASPAAQPTGPAAPTGTTPSDPASTPPSPVVPPSGPSAPAPSSAPTTPTSAPSGPPSGVKAPSSAPSTPSKSSNQRKNPKSPKKGKK